MLGYQVERLAIAPLLDVAGPSVTHQRGKRSRSEDGTDEVSNATSLGRNASPVSVTHVNLD